MSEFLYSFLHKHVEPGPFLDHIAGALISLSLSNNALSRQQTRQGLSGHVFDLVMQYAFISRQVCSLFRRFPPCVNILDVLLEKVKYLSARGSLSHRYV